VEGVMTFGVLVIIVFLNVMATIALWQEAARKPPKPKKKFFATLLHSKPIVPKHQPAKTVGEKFSSLITKENRLFFDDFADFAAVVNWWLADEYVGGPWTLQELPDTELKLTFSNGPEFGRRYHVFHNQVRLGTLDVSTGYPFSAEEKNVCAKIELMWVRLLTFDRVYEILESIALHVCNPDEDAKKEYRQRIDRALTQVLWQTQQISEFGMDSEDWGELELRLDGSASWYFVRREALRKKQATA
jgi:hypothetical protein